MPQNSVVISVFNCQWRRSNSGDAAAIRELVMGQAPDIVCLTEAYADFFGTDGHTIECQPDCGYPIVEGRRKAMLWSRNPWTDVENIVHPDLPPGRIISGRTVTAVGEIDVTGLCIPWQMAHVNTGNRNRKPWEDHIAYLSALENHFSTNSGRTIVLGDFNQGVPRKYQRKDAFRMLEKTLLSRLDIATSGNISPIGKQAIDHVCHSHDLVCEDVLGLPNITPEGRQISDHFGVTVKLAAR